MSPMPSRSRHGLRRRPFAMGMTAWGPLPGTRDAHILWGGPGDYLQFFASDPLSPRSEAHGRRVEHPAANGEYDDLTAAQRAVDALVDAYQAEVTTEREGTDPK
jgi:hypothetical protein